MPYHFGPDSPKTEAIRKNLAPKHHGDYKKVRECMEKQFGRVTRYEVNSVLDGLRARQN